MPPAAPVTRTTFSLKSKLIIHCRLPVISIKVRASVFRYCMYKPPFMCNVWPVMYAAASEARNKTGFTISIGMPRRGRGKREVQCGFLRRGHQIQHGRVHHTRRHHVDANTFWTDFQRQRPGKCFDSSFGCGVMRCCLPSCCSITRRKADNRSPSFFFSMWGSTAVAQRKTDVRLIFNVCCQ